MDKSIIVSVERRVPHPMYRKVVRLSRRFMANDPDNSANIGDVVRIRETRPISKRKCWELVQPSVADEAEAGQNSAVRTKS